MVIGTWPSSNDAELAGAGANIQGRLGALFFVRRYPLGAIGAVIMALFVLTALFAGTIAPFDPSATDAPALAGAARAGCTCSAPTSWAATSSAASSTAPASRSRSASAPPRSAACIGVAFGLASGYLGGRFDLLVQRLIDILQSLPLLVMALVMAASLGPSLTNTIIAIAIPLMPNVARVIRSNTLTLREMPFVEAARAVGMSEVRIAVAPRAAEHARAADRARHGAGRLGDPGGVGAVLPRPGHPRAASLLGPHAVGVRRRIRAQRAVAGDLPGIAISLVVFGTNLLGDAMRDALDPRQRKDERGRCWRCVENRARRASTRARAR